MNNIKGNKTVRNISLGDAGEMHIEISEFLIEKIKQEYDIDTVEDVHMQAFIRDVLKDASSNISNENI